MPSHGQHFPQIFPKDQRPSRGDWAKAGSPFADKDEEWQDAGDCLDRLTVARPSGRQGARISVEG